MKNFNFIYTLFIAVILTGCGGGSGDTSTPPTDLKIAGVWKLTERPANSTGGSDLALHTYLSDGTYYFAESNEINEGDDFEYGTYTFNNGVITVNAIVDTNTNIGIASIAQQPGLAINLNENTFSFPAPDPGDSGDYSYTREALSSSSIAGVWQINDTLFVFMDNGQYVGHQPTEDNDNIGFEFGTYAFDESMLTISTIDNSDGFALFCDLAKTSNCTNESFNASISGDSLTISFPDFGDVTLTKIL